MANVLKLRTEDITQAQIDALVRLYDAVNPVITSGKPVRLDNEAKTSSKKFGVMVDKKAFEGLCKAEKAVWEIT